MCLEVKMADKWQRKWEKPMRSLTNNDRIHVDKMNGIYMGTRSYHYDGIDILPVDDFIIQLHRGELF